MPFGFGGPGPGGPGFGGPGGHGGHGPGHGGPGFGEHGPGFGGPPGGHFGHPGCAGHPMNSGLARGAHSTHPSRSGGDPSNSPRAPIHLTPTRPTSTTIPTPVISRILATLSLLTGSCMLLANFLGAKIWHLGPIILDAGILTFPIVYICTDVTVELFGKREANRLAARCCIPSLIGIVSCFLAGLLPDLPGANNVNLAEAFGLSLRVMLASVIAFLISSLINNYIFEQIRRVTEPDNLFRRMLGSSLVARIFDTLIFSLIAFVGRTTAWEFIGQIFWSFVAGSAVEAALFPISKFIINKLKLRLDRAAYDAELGLD